MSTSTTTGLFIGIDEHEYSLNQVYHERDQLVAALTKVFPSHLAIDETLPRLQQDWRYIVCVHLRTGQATWHIHEDELPLFAHIENETRSQHWDEHDTAEKYRRLNALPRRWIL